MKIYWAGPLHDEEDQQFNKDHVRSLREQGHQVYLPQEHGVWEKLVERYKAELGMSEKDAIEKVRSQLYHKDCEAIQQCDVAVASVETRRREPSQGMMWEMGFAVGSHKPVILYNPYMFRYNLMPEYGSRHFTEWQDVLVYLHEMEFE